MTAGRLDGRPRGHGIPDPRVERWLGAPERPWRAGMLALRGALLAAGLDEALKWRLPCYVAPEGGNVAMLQPMKAELRLAFFQGVLLPDPEGRLLSAGPESRNALYLRFGTDAEAAEGAAAARRLAEAGRALRAEGRRVAPAAEAEPPAELAEALARDPDLSDAWDALTPGRRRGWALEIGRAKRAETRAARVERHRDAILEGRGPHDR